MIFASFRGCAKKQYQRRKNMSYKRTQYLIDRKFQLRYTFSILGFMFVVTAIIIGLMGINAAYNNGKMTDISKKNEEMIRNLESNMLSHDNILGATLTWVNKPNAMPPKDLTREITQTHYRELQATKSNVSTIKNNTDTMQRTINLNTIIIIAIIVIVIIQGIIFYIIMIRKTHKIAGPAYVMTQYCKEVIDGKYPETRNLRTGDELQELYDAFSKMLTKLREK